MNLAGAVAIVTGAGGGIGRSTAVALAEHGCHVVVNYGSSRAAAEATAAAVEARGVGALLVQGDVALDEDCRRIVAQALDRWSRLDVLVNNAATSPAVKHADLDGLDAAMWQRVLAVNVLGPFQMARAAAAALRAARGAVVNVSSVGGGGSSSIAYSASKAALDDLTRSLARVLAPEVRVNGVRPGFVDTPWSARRFGDRLERVRREVGARTPLGHHAGPEHVAQAVIALLTGLDFMTGESVTLDGGFGLGR